jgi:replicative DNA helicase
MPGFDGTEGLPPLPEPPPEEAYGPGGGYWDPSGPPAARNGGSAGGAGGGNGGGGGGGGYERTPPQDTAAEQGVLGGMLLSKDAIADVIDVVKGRDFYQPKHEQIFDAILDLYGRGEPADAVTVANELTKRNELSRVGGPAYLHTLMESVPTAANAGYYAEIVHERAILRRLVEAGTRITQMGYATEGDDIDEIVNRAQSEIYNVTEQRAGEDYAPLADIMEGALDEIESISNRSGQMTGVPTGFADLDSLTQGLHPGQMVIVAARPAMGKSTIGLDFARSCSIKNGLTSVIFSLEMGRNEITMRLLSAEARVALHHMRSGNMTDDDWGRLARRMGEVSAAPLFIDDSPNMSMMEIRAKCRRLKQRHDLRLVIVDYLQLMSGGGSARRAESRQQEVSEMSRNLKLLAKELEVPIVAIAQLNRGPEQRTDKKPMMSDLRESGSLEQDADVVILLHREAAYEAESPRAGEADLIVAKHRNGPTATITVAFQGHYSRFVDMQQS